MVAQIQHSRIIEAPRGRAGVLLAPLWELEGLSPRLEGRVIERFSCGCGGDFELTRFVLRGPRGPVQPVKLALFGVVHGDEPVGAGAISMVLLEAAENPDLLRGVDLTCYPVCNPAGLEDGTRHNRAGADLNRHFWRGSELPEIRILETELRENRFDGIIALHADCDSPGMYAFARGPVTSDELVAPALLAAEGVLPRNHDLVIDGFHATAGVIRDCYPGVLAPPPEQTPAPFEIILETPGAAPLVEQTQAAARALWAIISALPRLSFGGAGI